MGSYWGRYASLGDTFLENLQGLTTLKIYRADGRMHKKMDAEAESFRKATMRVLVMQLQSIAVMDLVAYGGAAAGILTALWQFHAGKLGLGGCAALVLLSAEFFLPLRQLGSYFHAAMTGMAASGRIFRLLDLPEPQSGTQTLSQEKTGGEIIVRNLNFSYPQGKRVLHGMDMDVRQGSFTAIVGESGCGKSTLAGVLTGTNRGYAGRVSIDGIALAEISADSLAKQVTYLGHSSMIFSGTVRENLLLGNLQATEETLWAVLEQVRLADFLRAEQGLDTTLTEQGQNFSGGQRQRLALARALLHDSPVYVLDEATSNIDSESESAILAQILRMRGKKSVIFITHRLANARAADRIYVMEKGSIAGAGSFKELSKSNAVFCKLWETQSRLEDLPAREEGAQ